MSRNKWIGLVAAIVIVSGIVWYFASPSYTLVQMRNAAKANDADALSSYIDYPSLREDMKSEFMAHMMAEAQKDESGFGALGVVFGSAMVGPIVDGMVSPAGVRAMLISSKQEQARGGDTPKPPVKVDENPIIERRSFSEFAVKSKSDANGAMIFTRHGLGWKLSGVDLPPPEQE
jgi:hypothetical protein